MFVGLDIDLEGGEVCVSGEAGLCGRLLLKGTHKKFPQSRSLKEWEKIADTLIAQVACGECREELKKAVVVEVTNEIAECVVCVGFGAQGEHCDEAGRKKIRKKVVLLAVVGSAWLGAKTILAFIHLGRSLQHRRSPFGFVSEWCFVFSSKPSCQVRGVGIVASESERSVCGVSVRRLQEKLLDFLKKDHCEGEFAVHIVACASNGGRWRRGVW